MTTPEEVREKALRRYERIYRTESGKLFTRLVERETADEEPSLSISLHPPTERQVLDDPSQAREWATSWRVAPLAGCVRWEARNWPSVGTQEVPVRFIAEGMGRIAECAGKAADWDNACSRVSDLAHRCRSRWMRACRTPDVEAVETAVKQIIGKAESLPERDWQTTLAVIDWFSSRPAETPYVRQLPIRGIDTKWMEGHRSVVAPLARALFDIDPTFAQPGKLVRVHALGEALSFDGVREYGLTIEGLHNFPHIPDIALICENLVNTLALPPIEGVLAIHGGGYAVADIADAPWLQEIPVLYWGDLDSNGFAILNRLRTHVPHAVSVMMDLKTLERHDDLCVEEPSPFTGELPLLTPDEHATLEQLIAGDDSRGLAALRLEQERVEWNWACRQISDAVRHERK